MAVPVEIWSGVRPSGEDLRRRIREALGVAGSADAATIVDTLGVPVVVKESTVVRHIGERPDDRGRWRFVPAIVPTIETAREVRQSDGLRRGYIARLPVEGAGARRFYVATEREGGRWAFRTIVPVGTDQKLRAARRRAGPLVAGARENPAKQAAYMGTGDPRRQDRAAQRLPGAAPALPQSTTPAASSPRPFGKLAALLLGAALLSRIAEGTAA